MIEFLGNLKVTKGFHLNLVGELVGYNESFKVQNVIILALLQLEGLNFQLFVILFEILDFQIFVILFEHLNFQGFVTLVEMFHIFSSMK
jgi:hypothetical protein